MIDQKAHILQRNQPSMALPLLPPMTFNPDIDTCPRSICTMIGLSLRAGDRKNAETWLLELIAWMAFDRDARMFVVPGQVQTTDAQRAMMRS